MQRYDMVFEVGTDILRCFYFDATGLGGRGYLDYQFKMQIRKDSNSPLISEFTTQNGKLIQDFALLNMVIPETEIFYLNDLEKQYVTETLPSPDNPTTVYAPAAQYDLISISPDGVYTRELFGKIGFAVGITQ